MSGTGRSGRPASVSDLVDGAAVPGARKLASPRRASIIWLTRSVRSPLAITQQITARTARARNTAYPGTDLVLRYEVKPHSGIA